MNLRNRVLVALALAAMPATASAQIVDFEGLAAQGCNANVQWVPNGYAGFNWSNMLYANHCALGPTYGTFTGNTSGTYVGANYYLAGYMSVSSGTFALQSVNLTAFVKNGQLGVVRGYLGSQLLFSSFTHLLVGGPTLVTLNWNGVDRVEFSDGDNPIIIDDINVAPEPATLLLLGSGLTGVGGILRRRRKA